MATSHPGVVFVDCEATGLARPSHPLSVGLAWCDGRTELRLVRPAPAWAAIPWDPAALPIHGLTPARVAAEGRDVREVAEWLNHACEGCRVCSDAPDFEAYWLGVLFAASGVAPRFAIEDAEMAVLHALADRLGTRDGHVLSCAYEALARRVRADFPHTHRAEEDALAWAMLYAAAAGEGGPGLGEAPPARGRA